VASTQLWTSTGFTNAMTGADLRAAVSANGGVFAITAEFPGALVAAGPRQPLLSSDLPAEKVGSPPPVPRPAAGTNVAITLTQSYVDAAATVLVDGTPCGVCSLSLTTGGGGQAAVAITLAPAPPAGIHAIQVLNPSGMASNEMPIVTQ
jgi:hypothetical protein